MQHPGVLRVLMLLLSSQRCHDSWACEAPADPGCARSMPNLEAMSLRRTRCQFPCFTPMLFAHCLPKSSFQATYVSLGITSLGSSCPTALLLPKIIGSTIPPILRAYLRNVLFVCALPLRTRTRALALGWHHQSDSQMCSHSPGMERSLKASYARAASTLQK